jgi:hypothetical protein
MPAIFNAQLSEYGAYYQVNNVFFTEIKYILPNAKYVDLPNQVALTLKNELNQGKLITIKKSYVDDKKSPDIPLDHFEIKIPETLDQKKSELKSKVQQRISAYTALLSGLDLYDFYVVTAKLQSGGFNVMDGGNKEEVYLNIINTGNEDLITDLERFLELKDRFDNILKKHKGIKEYFRIIDEAETLEELSDISEGSKGWLIN